MPIFLLLKEYWLKVPLGDNKTGTLRINAIMQESTDTRFHQNKGINLSTGQIIGMLNADDYFADDTVLSSVADIFNNNPADIVYGNLDYINSTGKTVRKWRSGVYKPGMFNSGWMPPHPTFYCKRDLFDQFGLYSLDYGTAADYQLMLRFMHVNKTNAFYLPQVMVKMKNGGSSNKNIRNRVKGFLYDFKAMRNNGILFPIMTLIAKPLRKILQYF